MKKSLIALILICALLLCGVCMAEAERTRLDAADCIVYRITNGKYRILDMDGKFIGDDYDADMEKMAADPITQKWWTYTHPCFRDHEKGVYYEDLEEIFYYA